MACRDSWKFCGDEISCKHVKESRFAHEGVVR